MAVVLPFQATRYTTPLTDVVAPPYDVLTDQLIASLKSKSPLNVTYLTHNAVETSSPTDSPYQHIGGLFQEWKRKSFLTKDPDPYFYYLKDQFTFEGAPYSREGILALICIEDGHTKILPHEHTLSYAVADRLALLKNTDVLFSPIFLIADDPKQEFYNLYKQATIEKPVRFSTLDDTVDHEFGLITQQNQIQAIAEVLSNQNLLIADGHHRYKTAVLYAQEKKQKTYVLAYITSSQSPGLVLSSIHRAVLTDTPLNDWMTLYETDFETHPLSKEKFKQSDKPFALIDYENQRMHLWKHPTVEIPSVCFQKEILETKMNIFLQNKADQKRLRYFKKSSELQDFAKQTPAILFWLNSVSIEKVFLACKEGNILPQKTTYFFPKIPDGLVFYEF